MCGTVGEMCSFLGRTGICCLTAVSNSRTHIHPFNAVSLFSNGLCVVAGGHGGISSRVGTGPGIRVATVHNSS